MTARRLRPAPNRSTRNQRLERAGYLHVAGWLPQAAAVEVGRQIEAHRADTERIEMEPRPMGRPKLGEGRA